MPNDEWTQVRTVKDVQLPLKPAAMRIYKSIFPNCRLEDLREEGIKVHILDKEFGIDSILHLESGQWLSIQEKYRDYPFHKFHDFTQEIKNGDGSPGEWEKLGAQLYFYGWGNPDKSAFVEWFLISIPHYKLIIERNGGILKAGKQQQNQRDGRAKFVGIPFNMIKPAILYFGTQQAYVRRLSDKVFSNPWPLLPLNQEPHP